MSDQGKKIVHLAPAFGHEASNAGKMINVQMSDSVMAMVSKTPMLDVPGWLERAMLPKEPMVVKALKMMARGVDVAMTSPTLSRSRITRWIDPAMPSPNNSGRTITLAKLNGRFNMTEAARVNKAARNSGAKISTISRTPLVKNMTRTTINMTVKIAASIKA